MEIDKNLNEWHPLFCAALKEYFKAFNDIRIIPEYNLSKNPLRIDVLIKNSEDEISNDIGKFFKEINIIEYKSPEDNILIDDYYKTIAYAYLYKSLREDDGNKEFIDIEKFTVSIFGSKKPQKLLKYLEDTEKLKVTEVSSGIYYIEGGTIPVQIVNLSKLDKVEEEYVLMIFSNNKELFRLATEKLLKAENIIFRDELIGTAYANNSEIFVEVIKNMMPKIERYKQENIVNIIKNTVDEDIIKKYFVNDILEKEKIQIIKDKDKEMEIEKAEIIREKDKEKEIEKALNLQDTIIEIIKSKFKSVSDETIKKLRTQYDIGVLKGTLIGLMNCNTVEDLDKLL